MSKSYFFDVQQQFVLSDQYVLSREKHICSHVEYIFSNMNNGFLGIFLTIVPQKRIYI